VSRLKPDKGEPIPDAIIEEQVKKRIERQNTFLDKTLGSTRKEQEIVNALA